MDYLQQFKDLLYIRDLKKIAYIWDEYSKQELLDPEELIDILKSFKSSPFHRELGQMIEKGVKCWEKITDPKFQYEVLKLIIDLEVSNNEYMADLALIAITDKYKDDSMMQEKLRLIGLREKESFRGALTNYDLLTHLSKGAFVYHTGGWGTGEVIDVSLVREELSLEFENVLGIKHLTFSSAFHQLIPLGNDHFLAKRFGHPDQLESEARKDPLKVIHLLLKDLGPKTAQEIKAEFAELVIPEEDWSKWWQNARAKIKKDSQIASPKTAKDPFALRKEVLTPEQRFYKEIEQIQIVPDFIKLLYSFYKDFAPCFKSETFGKSVKLKINEMLQKEHSFAQKLQIYLLILEIFSENKQEVEKMIKEMSSLQEVEEIEILALKKRVLIIAKKVRSNWVDEFLDLLFYDYPSALKDYALSELVNEKYTDLIEKKVEEILEFSYKWPHTFWWYFQKVMGKHKLPFCNNRGKIRFFEGFFYLLSSLESDEAQKELIKKMYQALIQDRYKMVRNIFEIASKEEVKELLLLASKCYTLQNQDQKILQSLAEVVYPDLGGGKIEDVEETSVIWTTKEGYEKIQNRIKEIGTVETVQNAREIEEARALGDLRENSEYKFALEKRARLQTELKMLSQQINKARILTPEDISEQQISVGHVVVLESATGARQTFTLLGPWDADPEKNILSFQSRFASSMLGKRVGDKFTFREEEYVVKELKNYFIGREA
jgi:transcription elongation factor GreA-like protein/transcription elongation GreA/GreB family factor